MTIPGRAILILTYAFLGAALFIGVSLKAFAEESAHLETASHASSETPAEPIPAETHAEIKPPEATSDQLDVVLLMDASGSMRVSDPLRLRDQGATLFTQFLRAGDRIGVVQFADTARVVSPLESFDSHKQKEFTDSIAKIGDAGTYTDILAGIEAATRMLGASTRPGTNQLIILLSDGKMDPLPSIGSSESQTKKLLDEVLPDLKTKNIKVHTLSFSDQADKDLLSQISVGTDAINWFTPSVDKIHESFADLFLVVKKPQVLPLSKKGFSIDRDIEEATFYVNREGESQLTVISPSGKRSSYENHAEEVKWFQSKKFDVVTIETPEVGVWQLDGLESDEGFATVLTNVKLITDWPAAIYARDELLVQARLFDGEKPIILPEMSGVINYGFEITPTDKVSEPILREPLSDEGEEGDLKAKDGTFSHQVLLDEPGEYRLKVRAKSPTFFREQNIPFRVRPALLDLEIETGEEGHNASPKAEGEEEHHGDSPSPASGKPAIVVKLSNEITSFKSVELELVAIDEKEVRNLLPIARGQKDPFRYEIPLTLLPHEGSYELVAKLTVKSKKGGSFSKLSNKVSYDYHEGESNKSHLPKIRVVEQKEVPVETSILIPLLSVIFVNGLAILVAFILFKPGKKSEQVVSPYEVPKRALDLITELSRKIQTSEVDLNDPKFASYMEQKKQSETFSEEKEAHDA